VTDANETDKSHVEQVVETLVFAPIGLLFEGSTILPQLVEKGRSHVAMARMVGKFAVTQGRSEAAKAAGKLQEQAANVLELIGGSLGAAPAIHDLEPPPPLEPLPEVAPEAHVVAPPGPKPAPRTGPSPAKAAVSKLALGTSAAAAAPDSGAAKAAPATKATASKTTPTKATPSEATTTKTSKATTSKASKSGGATAKASAAGKPAPAAATADPPVAETPVAAVDDLAIPDYDGLSASHVVNRLAGLTTDELEAVRRYEAANRGRKTILSKVAQLQSA
jgi:hypothetical protein